MSSTDRATQSAFYNHPWSLAIVVDPKSQQAGWFCGEECLPLDNTHVFVYQESQAGRLPEPAAKETISPEEKAYWQHRLERLKWLLPVGAMFLSLFIGLWYLSRDRV